MTCSSCGSCGDPEHCDPCMCHDADDPFCPCDSCMPPEEVLERVRPLGQTNPRVQMALKLHHQGMPDDQVLVQLIKGLCEDVQAYHQQCVNLLNHQTMIRFPLCTNCGELCERELGANEPIQ